jgi:hypothetical protein
MKMESLPPRVQDAEEPDLRSQMFRICRNRLQSFGCSPKQQIVHLAFILEGQCGQLCRQREHDMEIFAIQKFSLTFFQPLGPGEGLAFGAMSVRARVVGVTLVAALITLFEMTAERRGTATFDGAQYPLLPHGQRFGMRSAKRIAMGAHNIGDFKGGAHQRVTDHCG